MKFEDQYFSKHKFMEGQIKQYLDNAGKDLNIAKDIDLPEVRFNYSYSAFIKAGIAVLASCGIKTKSIPGHHVKIIEKLSAFLEDETVRSTGNAMRMKRNRDFYSGGVEITSKESREYLDFTEKVISGIKKKFAS